MNWIEEKMKELQADGVDFIPMCQPFFGRDYVHCPVVQSITIDEVSSVQYIPKTPYVFWIMRNGKKYYIMED